MSYLPPIALLLLLPLLGCRDPEARRLANAKDYVSRRPDMDTKLRDSVINGKVLPGMTPDEAIAAAAVGNYEFLILKKDPKWPERSDPFDVIYAQRLSPDSSIFRLDFRNRTQFGTGEPIVFCVCFRNGRAFRITKELADMCESGVTIP